MHGPRQFGGRVRRFSRNAGFVVVAKLEPPIRIVGLHQSARPPAEPATSIRVNPQCAFRLHGYLDEGNIQRE